MNVTADMTLPDEEVVRRVAGGETELFEVIMRRYNQRLYRTAWGIVHDPAEAEDVVQQAYVNAYVHLQQFAGRAQFATWLTKIAVYEALARVRARARLEQFDGAPETMGEDTMRTLRSNAIRSELPDPEHQALTGELRGLLEGAIAELPDAYRSVFVMRDVEGLNTAEVAECLDLSEEAIKTRLHRARGMLRETLYERAGPYAPQALRFDGARCDRLVAAVMRRIAGMTPEPW